MNVDPSAYPLIWGIGIMSAVLASAISAAFQILHGWRERLAADKRHMRDLALKAAMVQWEHDVARTKAHNEKASLQLGEPQLAELTTIDFDMILVQKLKLIEVFGIGRISGKDVEKGWREMSDIANAIRDCRHRYKSGK